MNLFNSNFNSKGQFFSPDLIIALGIFLFTLAFFWGASNFVFAQVDLFNSRIGSDEVAHSVLNNLILSSGEPVNWEDSELVDVNSFGLVHSNNFLDLNKTVTLINLLDSSDYEVVKYKLGAGKYDLELSVVDSKNEVISTPSNLVGGRVVLEPILKGTYTRVVYYNEQELLLKIILSIEE
jgi:hypothetical protein